MKVNKFEKLFNNNIKIISLILLTCSLVSYYLTHGINYNSDILKCIFIFLITLVECESIYVNDYQYNSILRLIYIVGFWDLVWAIVYSISSLPISLITLIEPLLFFLVIYLSINNSSNNKLLDSLFKYKKIILYIYIIIELIVLLLTIIIFKYIGLDILGNILYTISDILLCMYLVYKKRVY